MSEVVLQAQKRTVTGRKVGALRREGKLPAVMYGSDFESTPILLDLHETSLAMRSVSSSTVITIDLEGEKHACLVQDQQIDYLRNQMKHCDFRVLTAGVAISAMVPLNFVGEAPAVESFGGVLMTTLNEIEVEAKPNDLPASLDVDLSVLTDLGVNILVGDVAVPNGVTVLSDPEVMVATVTVPAMEEEEEEDEELFDEDMEPEVIEKGKQDEEDFED
jgi:large subunit ribosomal protein L25